MSIGKRTLIASKKSANRRLDPYAAVQLRIEHAAVMLAEARDELVPALRLAVEARAMVDADAASSTLEHALWDIERDLSEACQYATLYEDHVGLERARHLEPRLVRARALSAALLERRPPPAALPESPWLLSHGATQTAPFLASETERERAWRLVPAPRDVCGNVIDLAAWRRAQGADTGR